MEFEILGSVRVRGSTHDKEVTGRLQGTLLSLLLAHANQAVPQDRLVEAMWGHTDGSMAHKLQLHVYKLRSMVDGADRLVLTQGGYRLRVMPGELDAERFESLIDEAGQAAAQEPERCVRLIRKALGLWRGAPFAGIDVPALADAAGRLAERRLAVTELLYEAELRCGRHAEIVAELTDLVASHPLRERPHGLLMTALYRSGRQAEALEVYRRMRRRLVDELGLEPGPELRQIEQKILAGEAIELDPADAAPLTPAQLPHDVRGFTGREAELSELDSLAAGGDGEPVLIATIAGTAGVGKTALAIRWAHHARALFPDGQLYLDLRGYGPEQPVSSAEALASFLRALGVDGAAIPHDLAERGARYRTLLDRRRMLVVLDNARTADQVRPLLPGTRSCFVLVTSRDSLTGLSAREGAHRLQLDRLPTDRARALVRSLVGSRADAEADAVDTLIDRCANLPLALRVAAEQIRVRADTDIAELTDELADERHRLDLLGADGDVHTAVRTVFSWSYHHLPPATAHLFRFWGLHFGPDIDAAAMAALAGVDPRTAGRTLASLVRAHLAEEDPAGRYRMHDLMRAYARECADTEPAAHRDAAMHRLLHWYLHATVAARFALDPRARRIELADPPGHVPAFADHTEAMRWFELHRVNLVAAVAVAAGRAEHTIAWQLTSALLTYFYLSKHWSDWITTHRIGLVAATRAGDAAGEAHVRNGLAVAYSDLKRFDEAIACHNEATALYERTGDRSGQAWNLNNVGVAYDRLRRFPEAVECYRAALRLFRELGDARGQGLCLSNLGDVHRQLNEHDVATEYLHQAMRVQREAGDLGGQRFTLRSLGDLQREAGRPADAMNSYREALVISRQHGDRLRVAQLLRQLAPLSEATGDHDQAREYTEQARQILEVLGEPPDSVEQDPGG